jgi:membrane dipeptidase
VVAETNKQNMMIDVGHSSPETMMAVAEASEKPIACSHAGLYSQVAQFRSTTDEAIKAVAAKGGVYGVITTPAALNGKDRCTINDFLDTMEYAINLIGIDHVGIGSDLIVPSTLDQILTAPEWDPKVVASIGKFEVWPWSDGHVGFENNSGYPNVTRGLVKRGYSDADISKILGGNWMRLIKETIG